MITGGYDLHNKRFINKVSETIMFDTLDNPPREK